MADFRFQCFKVLAARRRARESQRRNRFQGMPSVLNDLNVAEDIKRARLQTLRGIRRRRPITFGHRLNPETVRRQAPDPTWKQQQEREEETDEPDACQNTALISAVNF